MKKVWFIVVALVVCIAAGAITGVVVGRKSSKHKNVLEMLIEADLPDDIFEDAFMINWRAKHAKLSINFDPINFGYDGKNLYYLAQIVRTHNDKWNLEGGSIYLWYYTKEFVQYLMDKGLDIDKNRANVNQGYLRKQIALSVIQHYK